MCEVVIGKIQVFKMEKIHCYLRELQVFVREHVIIYCTENEANED